MRCSAGQCCAEGAIVFVCVEGVSFPLVPELVLVLGLGLGFSFGFNLLRFSAFLSMFHVPCYMFWFFRFKVERFMFWI